MKNGQTVEQYQCAVCLLVKIWNMEELLTDVPERKTSRKTSRKNEKMTKKNEKCDRGLDKDRTFVQSCKYGWRCRSRNLQYPNAELEVIPKVHMP